MKALNLLTRVALSASTLLFAQQPPLQNESIARATTLPEIQVDHDCRILTAGRASAHNPNPKPHFRDNEIICHIEGEHTCSFWDNVLVDGKPKHVFVTVEEREYVLQNPGPVPVAYLVAQPLPKGWSIDSDPQPIAINGKDAIFRVVVQPGQLVRLHVGERT
jgi:hypothetical protein